MKSASTSWLPFQSLQSLEVALQGFPILGRGVKRSAPRTIDYSRVTRFRIGITQDRSGRAISRAPGRAAPAFRIGAHSTSTVALLHHLEEKGHFLRARAGAGAALLLLLLLFVNEVDDIGELLNRFGLRKVRFPVRLRFR